MHTDELNLKKTPTSLFQILHPNSFQSFCKRNFGEKKYTTCCKTQKCKKLILALKPIFFHWSLASKSFI